MDRGKKQSSTTKSYSTSYRRRPSTDDGVGMGSFDSVSWKVFEQFLIENGCVFKRMKGDHRVYTKSGLLRPLVVPQYKPIPPFILLNNLRVLGVEKDEFLKFLDR